MQVNVKDSGSPASKNIIIRLDSNDDYCMLVSIQNASVCIIFCIIFKKSILFYIDLFFQCPIFDTENDILFEGFYETVSRQGGLTIPVSVIWFFF